jgi:hypothetical protein
MFQRRDFVICFTAAFSMLVMMIWYLEKKNMIESPYDWDEPKVRFCCKNFTACSEENIRATFIESSFQWYRNPKEEFSFRILQGRPTCSSLKPITDEFKFTTVSFFLKINYSETVLKFKPLRQ